MSNRLTIRPAATGDLPAVVAIYNNGRLDAQWKDCVLVERLLGEAAGS